MRILDRYVLREIALYFFAITSVLAIIMLSVQVAKVLDLASNSQLPRGVVLTLVGLTSITQLTLLMPFGLFLGIVVALGRLYHDSEMAAVQAAGIGIRQLYRPVLALTLVVVAVLVWLALLVVPDVFGRAYQIRMDAFRQARLANIAPQHFAPFPGGDFVYYAESIDSKGVLYNVFVQRRVGDKVEVIVANRAEQIGAGDTQQTFVLYNGQIFEGVPGSGVSRTTKFAELGYPFQLTEPASGSQRVESKPSWDLYSSGQPTERAELERRIASPLMALILALLAVPVARLRPRQGRYAKMSWALSIFFIYQIAVNIASVWIEKQSLMGVLGIWWVHAVMLMGALWLVMRQDPVHKTAQPLTVGAP